jgi:hypothetical protein
LLAQGTINYWRVKPINTCTSGSFSEVYVFQIANDLCRTYTNATFSPNAVWEVGTTNAVSAKITVPDNIVISKVSFYMKATHSSVNDIKMQFSGPTGIFAEVYNRDCATGSNFDVTFDDAGTAITCGSNPGLGGTQQASQSLSKFNGSSSLGAWTLLATDRVPATSGGTFSLFNVIICGKLQIVNNISVANNALTLKQGATATIAQAKLGATQPSATTAQLTYTITQLPINGTLKLNNVAMVAGGTFTQADINNNLLSYTNNGINANPDSFKFSVNGINLALFGGQTFNIIVCGAPVPDIASLPDITGQCAVTITAPTATSNCYGQITGTTATTFPITTPGTTVVTWNFNDGNGQSINLDQNVIIESTSWNGASWSNGTPTSAKAAIIAGNYSAATNITACTLTVNNNAVVSIPSGYNVTLNGALTISSGSFTLENNANLIQTSNVANSGNINIKRSSSALFRLDYTLWSSPVAGSQTLGLFSPLTSTNRFYEYNTTTNLYNPISNGSPFGLAKGYLIRMPNTWVDYVAAPPSTPLPWTGTFTGVPNNGNLTYTMSQAGTGFNAVGNPYPSTLNIDNFINGNTGNINGTLYFWRKRNDATNLTSYSTCTTAGCSLINSHLYTNQDYISIGQGFIVKATSTTLNFNNSMRIANTTNQFFKSKQIEKNRIWLNLLNDTTPVNQMLLAYMTGATMGIDSAIDGAYINDSSTALNSLIGSEEFAVQGRALPFDGTDEVPLSFKATTPGNYSIAIDHVDGLFSGNQDIILKDNDTGRETDLKTGAYTFFAPAGLSNTRFTLKYQKTLGTNTPVFDENSIVVFKNNGYIHIKSNGKSMHNVKLFDVRGRLIAEKSKVNSNEISIESSRFANEVLIVKITSDDNKVVNKKVAN